MEHQPGINQNFGQEKMPLSAEDVEKQAVIAELGLINAGIAKLHKDNGVWMVGDLTAEQYLEVVKGNDNQGYRH